MLEMQKDLVRVLIEESLKLETVSILNEMNKSKSVLKLAELIEDELIKPAGLLVVGRLVNIGLNGGKVVAQLDIVADEGEFFMNDVEVSFIDLGDEQLNPVKEISKMKEILREELKMIPIVAKAVKKVFKEEDKINKRLEEIKNKYK